MNKNVVIGIIVVLLIAVIGEGYYVNKERNDKKALAAAWTKWQLAITNAPKPRPSFFTPGKKFADNPLSSKAFLIAPVSGDLNADAQKALTGWTVDSAKNEDGSTQITLSPKDTDDVKQTFTLKTGFKLYFLEMTFGDEANDLDHNRGDDTGILVDDKGIIQ